MALASKFQAWVSFVPILEICSEQKKATKQVVLTPLTPLTNIFTLMSVVLMRHKTELRKNKTNLEALAEALQIINQDGQQVRNHHMHWKSGVPR